MPGSRKPGSTGFGGFHEAVNDGTLMLIASPNRGSVGSGQVKRSHSVLPDRLSRRAPVVSVHIPVLRFDSRGALVETLQRTLNSRAQVTPLIIDGIFGPKTEAAVIRFQRTAHLALDGIVGKKTWFALAAAPVLDIPTPNLKQNTSQQTHLAAPNPNLKQTPSTQTYPSTTKSNTAPVKKQVPEWSLGERFEYVLWKSLGYMVPALADQVRAMFTGAGLAILIGSLVVWAAGQFAGYGEVVDAFLVGFGLPFLGMAIFDVVKLLANFLVLTATAQNEAGLDEAANDFARALAIVAAAVSIAKFFSALRAATESIAGEAAGAGRVPPPETKPNVGETNPSTPTAKPAGPPAAPAQGPRLSGHGDYNPAHGTVTVPEGTSVTVFAEHGATISDSLGGQIESGGDVSGVYSKTYGPGEEMPNYTLHPPDDLNIQSGPDGPPTTVSQPTNLSDLLQPNQGNVNWAACTYEEGSPNSSLMYDTNGVFDESSGKYIKTYE